MKGFMFAGALFLLGFTLESAPLRSDFDPKLPRRTEIGKAPVLVLDEKTHVVVVPEAGPVEKFAASELSDFLGKALGVRIPVVNAPKSSGTAICVGDNPYSRALGIDVRTFDRDGFAIKSGKNRIAIAGRDSPDGNPAQAATNYFEHATLFGVYDFLERFAGVRFYFPGEFGEVVPKTKEIPLGAIDIYDRPDHFQRRSQEYGNSWYDGTNAKKGPVLQDYRRRSQTFYVPCCHSLEHSGYYRRFAKTHPEYFAVDPQGKIYSPDHPSVGSLCYLSPGFRNELYLDAVSFLKGEPPSSRGILGGTDREPRPGFTWSSVIGAPGIFSIMPGDHHRRCLCPKCVEYMKRHGESEYVWDLVCDIAERLQKAGIPCKVTAMAYARYTTPPERRVPDNLEVMVATTGPWAERDEKLRNAGDTRITAWTEKLGKKVWLWTYPHKLSSPAATSGVPQMAPHTIGKYYQRQAPYTFGAFYEAESDQWIFNYLNTYVFFKVSWDNSTDVNALIAEHHKQMFGPAADEMKKFYDELESIWMGRMIGKVFETELGPVTAPPDVREIWEQIYSPSKLLEFEALFDRAEKRCGQAPEAKKRIGFIRKHFLDALKMSSQKYFREKEALAEWKFFIKPLASGEKITVDGKLDDSGWKTAESIWLLPCDADACEVKTRVFGRADDQNLYFGFECMEPRMNELIVRQSERDHKDLWQDSEIEIMLNPSGDGTKYYQFIINAHGIVGDYANLRLGGSSRIDDKWNSHIMAKTSLGNDRFFIEAAIPRKDLPDFQAKGFKANFCRHRALSGKPVGTRYYSWSPNRSGFHDLEKFGCLHFAPEENKSLIKNGDFTKPFSGSWSPSTYKSTRENGPLLDDHCFITGGQSARISSTGEFHSLFQSLPLKANTTYAVSFFLKMENVKPLKPGGGFQILLGDNRNNFFPETPYTGTMPWTRQGTFWTTGPDGGRVIPGRSRCIRFGLRDASGSVWIDDVKFVEIPKK